MNSSALERYLSGLTITQGRRAGERFKLLPWQRRFLRGAFAPGADVSALSIARGNGKTALAAAIEGPLVVPRAEIVIVASSFSQATIAFEHVLSFMGDRSKDRTKYRLWQSGQLARIQDRETGAMVRCLGVRPAQGSRLSAVSNPG